MTVTSKSSAYPATVQPGIPKLAECPAGWRSAPLSDYLHEERRPTKLKDEAVYDLVTVKRARGGVVVREALRGEEIAVKSQFKIEAGDFLISKRQIVHGACGLVPEELEGSIVSNEYAVMHGNGKIDLRYLNYLAHSIYFQQTCFHSSIGVHVEKMIFKVDKWLKWKFNIPPLPEQKKIAEILGTWDAAIAAQEKLIANSETQKKALMQQLLTGKKRLKGFSGKWETVSLHNIADIDKQSLGKNTPDDFSFRYISLSDVVSKRISNDLETIVFSKSPSRARRILNENDILMATVRPNLQAFVYVDIKHADCIASTGFAVLSIRKNHSAYYLYQYLFSHHIKAQIDALVVGTNYPAINSSDVSELAIHLPPTSEQTAIAAILSDADREIELQQQKLATLRQEKFALMQQLLTGKRRVTTEKQEKAA